MVKGKVVVVRASGTSESLSLAVIVVEWWWNNDVMDSKLHGKEKIPSLATKNTPVVLRSALYIPHIKLHRRTIRTNGPDQSVRTVRPV